MLFDVAEGTPETGGRGCHPLYPAVDHIDPGNPHGGHQIVCYALNDLKGHLPFDCFEALKLTEAWKKLMAQWREQAANNRTDREAFRRLLRPNAKPKRKQNCTSEKQEPVGDLLAGVMKKLNTEMIAYAADEARGESKGFAALYDLPDANTLLPSPRECGLGTVDVLDEKYTKVIDSLKAAVTYQITMVDLYHKLNGVWPQPFA
jgi:hypothetical protein